MTQSSVESSLPERPDWKPYWPKPLKVLWLLALAFFVMVSAIFFVVVASGIRDRDWGIVAGNVALIVGFSLPCSALLAAAGISRSTVPNSVGPTHSDRHGDGLLFRCKSSRLLVVGLLGYAVCGLIAGAVRYIGKSESLLPASRDNDAVSGFVLVGGLVLLAFVVAGLLRTRTDMSVHPDGILRRSYKRRWPTGKSTEDFVRWDDIDEIQVDTFDVHTNLYTVRNPLIRVVCSDFDPNRTLQRFDTQNSMALRAFELGADPNAIMALLLWCREYPEIREQLSHDDARNLLPTLSLRHRLRLSRAASARNSSNVR